MLITGNWKNDSEYYRSFLHPIIMKNFGYSGRLYHRKDDNTARFWINNKDIIQYFVDNGLPVGPKAATIKIPHKIMINKRLSISCVHGIFNTDGCVYRRYSKQYKNHSKSYTNYAVVEFKVKSKALLIQIKYILESNEIKTNSIIKNKIDAYVLRITSQQEVSRFMKIIKPRKYHLERYKSITNKEILKSGPVAQPGRAPASISS